MKKILFLVSIVLFSVLFFTVFNFDMADAYKTGSYNFCSVFPLYPECVGWRTEAISDSYNYWFCNYVDIEKFCENKPDPEKQIVLRNQDFCCRFVGPELEIKYNEIQNDSISDQLVQLGIDSSPNSILPLIIWTDKDHYNFRDKVTVYGKFHFASPVIKKSVSENEFEQTGEVVDEESIQTGRIITETPVFDIDIELNGRKVLKNIPVHENGWFVAFFYLNDVYHFSNQDNLLEVEYISYDPVPLGGPRTHATYHFTTGEIAEKEDGFDIWIDDSSLPNEIKYGVIVKNPERFIELTRYDLINTRLITPDGFVISIDSPFSIQDLSTEYNGFLEYGEGTYEIQVTYGNNMIKKTFEYINSN